MDFDEANHRVVEGIKVPTTQQQVDTSLSYMNDISSLSAQLHIIKRKCVATVDTNLARSSGSCHEQSTVSWWISMFSFHYLRKLDLVFICIIFKCS